MTQYTSSQIAAMTGKAERTIRQLAERHPEIGTRVGYYWIFSEADVKRILAVRRGGPRRARGRGKKSRQPQPGPAMQPQEATE